MSLNLYSVPTVPVAVQLWCTGGRTMLGHVFVPEASPFHDGKMDVEEWLNLSPPFFPFQSPSIAERTVLHKRDIVSVTFDADEGVDVAPPAPEHRSASVRVEADGYRVEGTLALDMPEHQQRVVDFLNRPEPFFTVRDGSQRHVIHKAHVTRVAETEEW